MPNMIRALVPLLVLAVPALVGCGGPDFETLCQEREDCEGGNELDVEACVTTLDGEAERADILGCTDELDLYYECIIPELKCRNEAIGGACATDADCGGGCIGAGTCSNTMAVCTTDADCAGGTCTRTSPGICNASGDSCMTNAECVLPGVVCSGGECSTKYFGFAPGDDDVCEAESNAYESCD